MKKSSNRLYSGMSVLLALFCAAMLTAFSDADAKAEVASIEGASYNVNSSIAANLKALAGKKVNITLNSGNALSGFVKEVGNHLIHLEKLDGKDFCDALIRIDAISAIDTRFRDYQR